MFKTIAGNQETTVPWKIEDATFFAGNSHTKIRHMETVIWELAVAGKC